MGSIRTITYVDDFDKKELAEDAERQSAVLEWNGQRRQVTMTPANFKKLDEQLTKLMETADPAPAKSTTGGKSASQQWLEDRGITIEHIHEFEQKHNLPTSERGVKKATKEKWDEING